MFLFFLSEFLIAMYLIYNFRINVIPGELQDTYFTIMKWRACGVYNSEVQKSKIEDL